MVILALYVWARFIPTGYNLPIGLAVSDLSAAFAAVTSVASLVFYFWMPKEKINLFSSIAYFMIVALVTVLIATSGSIASPFSGAWILVAIFAGYFGIIAIVALFAILALQVILSYLYSVADTATIITHFIFGLMPLVLGLILWHRQPSEKRDKSLSELANKLSTVEGKSDVVINTIDDGVMAINRNGIIDLINPSAQTLVGWNKGDALGLDWRSVLKLVSPDGREVPAVNNPIAKALANNEPAHEDKYSIETPSGKRRLVSIVSSPVGNNNDGIIVVFRDITREKAEEREQAEFISTASHEMRTPVASIEGYLGLALNPATATIDEKARDFITKAHESAQYLGRLFQDLLDISKAEEGILKNNPKVIDVSATVEDIFEKLSHLAKNKNLRYFFKPNPSLESDKPERRLDPVYYTYVDPGHFREVISNLIENAIKYTPAGDVTVDVAGDSEMVTVSIHDTGIGIPPEDIPHLFQKFYRVDNTDTREIGGTGLGLFLCRRLAEMMDGHLRVESTYRKGSTFFFDLPRISHEDAMNKIQEASEESSMIVNDRPILTADTPAQSDQAVTTIDTQPPVGGVSSQNSPMPQPNSQTSYIGPAQPTSIAPLSFNAPQPPALAQQPAAGTENYTPYTQVPSASGNAQATYTPNLRDKSYTSMTIAELESLHTPKASQEEQAQIIMAMRNKKP